MEKQSVIVVSQLSSVLKSELVEYIGALSAERIDQVLAGLRLQQKSFFGHSDSSTSPSDTTPVALFPRPS